MSGLYPSLNDALYSDELPAPPPPIQSEDDEGIHMRELTADLPVYDNKLYTIQLSAPKPIPVKNLYVDEDKPSYYGDEYHGKMERSEVKRVLGTKTGNFIVRESVTQPGKYSLSFVFDGEIKHYLIDYRKGKHCIGDKEFDSVYSLTMDGLISLHVQKEAGDYLHKCINTMRVLKKVQDKLHPTHEEEEENGYLVVEETASDGVRLRPKRNMAIRQTVKVSSFYESQSQDFVKKHRFNIHTYFGFPFCKFCNNYMWGLTQQGYACSDCGMDVHHQCRTEIPDNCKPNKKRITKVFGVDLTTLVLLKNIDNIPNFLNACIATIEGRGMETEGLYRVNGNFDAIRHCKEQIDCDNESVLEKADTFVLCSLLKQFLRELPMPLVTYDAYNAFVDSRLTDDHDARIGQTKDAIRLLPDSHFHSLKALVEHLARLSSHSDLNHMTIDNLAIVFGPTIFRSPSMSPDSMMADMVYQKVAVKFMVEHCWRLFR